MLLLKRNEPITMHTYQTRQWSLSLASHLERTSNPNGYIKRKKIVMTALVTEYREAIRPFLKTDCIASAEAKADQAVSTAHNWPTLQTLRAENLARMQREISQ